MTIRLSDRRYLIALDVVGRLQKVSTGKLIDTVADALSVAASMQPYWTNSAP